MESEDDWPFSLFDDVVDEPVGGYRASESIFHAGCPDPTRRSELDAVASVQDLAGSVQMSGPTVDAPSIRFRASRWARAEAAGSWGASHPASRLPLLYVVEQGRAIVSTRDSTVEAEAGDLVLLPRGDSYRIASDHRADTPPMDEVARAHGLSCSPVLSLQGNGTITRAAGFSFVAPAETAEFLRLAPDLLHVRGGAGDSWTSDIARALSKVARDGSPSASMAATKLGELAFGSALAVSHEAVDGAWLVFATANLLRSALDFPWTAEEIARRLGRSRASFYESFTREAGVPPMMYLTKLRLREGERLLGDTELSVAAIAEAVGFASSSSFAAAFRQHFGESPSAFRATRRRS